MTRNRFEPKWAELPSGMNTLSGKIVDAAFAVHSELGPGLLENIYEQCLLIELRNRDLEVKRHVDVPVVYKGDTTGTGIRIDLLVEDSIVVELKAVETVLPVHKAQVLTYLKLTGHRLGLLINFNVSEIKQGIHRVIL
ncbi:MAG: GxxExxY protein [Thermoanaerobaculales bacterium]|nr:GxxExxY protein [Thermoanaerobaculales bacterium]